MNTSTPSATPKSLGIILTEVMDKLPSGEKTTSPTAAADPIPARISPQPSAPVFNSVVTKTTGQYELFIAIDWADQKHDLCEWKPATGECSHHEMEHDPNTLHAWLQNLHQHYPGQRIAVALEQKTGSLFNFLADDDLLDIYSVNPAMVAQYRKAFHPSGAKDDPTDAGFILDLLLHHRNKLTLLTPEDPLTRRLQILTRKRRDAVNLRTKFNNQLKALLKQYFPLFLKVCGDNLYAPMACQLLLQYPCLSAMQQAKPEILRQFYISHGSWNPDVIARRLKLIQNAKPLTTDETLISSAMLEATMLAQLLIKVGEHINNYDKTLAQLLPQHPDAPIFDSFPGAGVVFAPRLLAAFGTNRQLFQTATNVHNRMGISPVKKASGMTTLICWRKACPKFLRQSFQEYADESTRHSIWARAYYQMQRDRGKKHQAAVRALAFKWIRIMFRCWQARQPYDELRYLAALQHRHAPLLEYISKSDQVFGN